MKVISAFVWITIAITATLTLLTYFEIYHFDTIWLFISAALMVLFKSYETHEALADQVDSDHET